MQLLVVVETLNGIFISRSIAKTFMTPAATPAIADTTPAPSIIRNPAGTPCTLYARGPADVGYSPRSLSRSARASGAVSPAVCAGALRDVHAVHSSTAPKPTNSHEVGTPLATTAPRIAPKTVATSSSIPIRTFVYPSRTYAAAAPDEVAMIATSDAPIAYLRSIPNASTISGIRMTPPPSPVSDPTSPASADDARMSSVKATTSTAAE